MNRAAIVAKIMAAEGWPTFTCDPADHGGATKGGITLAALSAHLARQATVDELRDLPETTARAIYWVDFIQKPGFALIEDDRLAEYVVDIAVTSGPARAIRYLQRVAGAKDDGVLGPKTAAAVNTWDAGRLLHRLIAYRAVKMAALVQEDAIAILGETKFNALQLKWIEGWIRRAVDPLGA